MPVEISTLALRPLALGRRFALGEGIIDFLSDRFQRTKLVDDCFSEWGLVPSGVPQGMKLGP